MAFKYQQLTTQLVAQLQSGYWQPGEKLPSVRRLCTLYHCSLATVQHALQQLEAMGWLQAVDRSGYYVQRPATTAAARPPTALPSVLAAPTDVTVPALFYDVMQRSAAFDFYPAGPLVALPQLAQLHRLQRRVMRELGTVAALRYDEPRGALPLREQLALHYQAMGLALQPDELCLTAGCQHALFLALKASCQPGDIVAVEQPGFYGVLQLLEQLQLRALEIPLGAHGMDMAVLERALRQWPIKACVVTPAFATPTGVCLSPAAKLQLLALAEHHDFAIIEDDIYGDLGFVERPTPVKALDTTGRVLLCGSFSKALSRDVRVGWIAAGRYQAQVERLKLVTQLAGSQTHELALAQFMAQGHYRRHLQHFRQRLQHQHHQLQQLLQQLFAKQPQVRWSEPSAGLALWLELAPHIDTVQLYAEALSHGVVLTPGAMFSQAGSFGHCLRLSFSNPVLGPRAQALQWLAAKLTA